MNLAKGNKLGHYILAERIGAGGMGEVWKAADTRLSREVAVKFLSSSFLADPQRRLRFREEARTLAALCHPHIVTIYSVEEASGHAFFTMELIRGKTLSRMIPPRGWPAARVFELAIPLADAVSTAHAGGLVHRDLKPSNIMVGDDGNLKVLDFGLARSGSAHPPSGHSGDTTISLLAPTASGGTPAYMAPEQVRGEASDTRADIFALGVILYEMSCGSRPFTGSTPADLGAAILRDTPAPLTEQVPGFPDPLWRLVRRCLEKSPDRRLQTALDLRNELQDLARERVLAADGSGRAIAVLPFRDLSFEKDQGYFCEGIAEEILNALSALQDLKVVSRPAAFGFGDSELDGREIGRQLGVGILLEGSVRKAGEDLRVTVRLTDVREGLQIWSDRYDRSLVDVFSVQDDIARRVVEALEVRLRPGEAERIARNPTRDVNAYDCYLRGRQFFFQYRRKGVEYALHMFRQAIRRDPLYAQAYAGVADCCSFLYLYGGHDETHRMEALEASARALELAPEQAQAHTSHAVALSLLGRHQEAEEAFERALRLDPHLFETYYFYARDCFIQGRMERAINLYERAAAVRPEDYQSLLLTAQIYEDTGQKTQARQAREEGLRIAERHLQTHPDDSRALYLGANALVVLGQVEKGMEWARRAQAREPDEPMLLYNVACVQALAGRADDALATLEHAVVNGLTQREWLERDTNLDSIRPDPRFQALLERLQS